MPFDSHIQAVHVLVECKAISRTKFIEDRGAKVSLKIRGRHYRRSPLVQGGLEVPCDVTITMIGSVVNHFLLRKTLLNEFYLEPQEGEIIGTFLTLNTNIKIEEPRPRAAKKKERKKKTDSNSVVSRDIRNPKKKKEDKVTIVLD